MILLAAGHDDAFSFVVLSFWSPSSERSCSTFQASSSRSKKGKRLLLFSLQRLCRRSVCYMCAIYLLAVCIRCLYILFRHNQELLLNFLVANQYFGDHKRFLCDFHLGQFLVRNDVSVAVTGKHWYSLPFLLVI